jgi:hypothetical protein
MSNVLHAENIIIYFKEIRLDGVDLIYNTHAKDQW